MMPLPHKHASNQGVVAGVYRRVRGRLVSVEDTAPEDPFVITFVRTRDGAELCTIRTEGNDAGRYDIIADEIAVPRCLIRGVVWRVRHGLRRKRS
jgi:hypothetical protein